MLKGPAGMLYVTAFCIFIFIFIFYKIPGPCDTGFWFLFCFVFNILKIVLTYFL